MSSELIDGPFVIWVDGENISDFELVQEDNLNVLTMNSDSQYFTVIGISIIPEFGSITVVVFGTSVVTMIILSQKSRIST